MLDWLPIDRTETPVPLHCSECCTWTYSVVRQYLFLVGKRSPFDSKVSLFGLPQNLNFYFCRLHLILGISPKRPRQYCRPGRRVGKWHFRPWIFPLYGWWSPLHDEQTRHHVIGPNNLGLLNMIYHWVDNSFGVLSFYQQELNHQNTWSPFALAILRLFEQPFDQCKTFVRKYPTLYYRKWYLVAVRCDPRRRDLPFAWEWSCIARWHPSPHFYSMCVYRYTCSKFLLVKSVPRCCMDERIHTKVTWIATTSKNVQVNIYTSSRRFQMRIRMRIVVFASFLAHSFHIFQQCLGLFRGSLSSLWPCQCSQRRNVRRLGGTIQGSRRFRSCRRYQIDTIIYSFSCHVMIHPHLL